MVEHRQRSTATPRPTATATPTPAPPPAPESKGPVKKFGEYLPEQEPVVTYPDLTTDQLTVLADQFWKWLDKPRVESAQYWLDSLQSMYRTCGLDLKEFTAFLHWVAIENEFTAGNLRVALNPMKSLVEKQLMNCLGYYWGHKSALRIRERKSWKHGACGVCDEAPASRDSKYCEPCDQRLDEVFAMVKGARPFLETKGNLWRLYHGQFMTNTFEGAGGGSLVEIAVTLLKDPDMLVFFQEFLGRHENCDSQHEGE
jgi:hypothetical protein